MRILFIAIALLFAVPLHSQSVQRSVIASGGGNTSGSSISANSTLGEPVVTTLTSGSHFLSQGFQQTEKPGEDQETSVQENIASGNTELRVYPNPVDRYLHFTQKLKNVTITIRSLEGKTCLTKDHKNLNNMDVSGLPSGVYVITVRTREESLVSKFVKE